MAKAKDSGLSAQNQVTRRRLLTAASAVVAVGAVPAIATAADALTIPERFALLPPEDQALVLAEMDRLELARETPVAALFREWQEVNDAETAAFAADEWGEGPECAAASAARKAAETRLIEAPAQSERDVLLKILAVTAFGLFGTEQDRQHDLWAEARAFVEGRA